MEKAKANPFIGITKWFRESKSELKKVVWPTVNKIRQNTSIVLLYILIIGSLIWVLDLGFVALMQIIVK